MAWYGPMQSVCPLTRAGMDALEVGIGGECSEWWWTNDARGATPTDGCWHSTDGDG